MRLRYFLLVLSLVFLFNACSSTPSNDADIGQIIAEFDNWPDPQPFLKQPTGQAVNEQITLDNVVYDCTTTPFELTNTPAEIVTFEPNASLFWVGNLLQGKGIKDGIGSFGSIPVKASKRAPFIVSIDLLTGNNFKSITMPSQSAVDSAVGELIETAENAGLVSASRAFFESESSFQSNQIALELDLAAEYLSTRARESLSSERADNENTVTAYFVEKAFTVSIDFEGKSGVDKFFNENFSEADLKKLESDNLIANDNLPTYLASVTYGRILMFSLTSNVTASIIKELIDKLNEGIDGNGANALTEEQKQLLESVQDSIKVVGIGGPAEANSALIASGDLSQYFAVDAPLTSMVPISYEVKTLKGDKPAVVSRTTTYEQKECTPNTNIPPLINSMTVTETNLDVTLNASITDVDGQIAKVELDWGDGTVETLTSSSVINEQHSYADDNAYTISLNVTDNQNATTSRTVTAEPKFDLRRGLIAEFTEFIRVPGERQMQDSSGNDNNGFLNTSNSTELSTAVDRFGLADKAIDFRGIDAGQASVAEVRSTASDGAIAYGEDYSLAIWVESTRFGYLIGPKEQSSVFNSAGLYKPQSSDFISFDIPLANAGAGYKLSDPDPATEDWSFYVVTIDRSGSAASLKLYKDGLVVNEDDLEGLGPDVLPTASPFIVGARANYTGGGGGNDFQGVLDDIRIYDRALSAGEVRALFNESPANPVGP